MRASLIYLGPMVNNVCCQTEPQVCKNSQWKIEQEVSSFGENVLYSAALICPSLNSQQNTENKTWSVKMSKERKHDCPLLHLNTFIKSLRDCGTGSRGQSNNTPNSLVYNLLVTHLFMLPWTSKLHNGFKKGTQIKLKQKW